MRFVILLAFGLISSSALAADIEYRSFKAKDGAEFQTCARYPDPKKFPGPYPVLLFIEGSGLYDMCLRLKADNGFARQLTDRGVIAYAKQKRGVRVDPVTSALTIDREVYATNTIPTLKADALDAIEGLSTYPKVDLDRVAVAGGSEGTWLATAIGLQYPKIKEVLLFSAPIENFDTCFERQTTKVLPQELFRVFDTDNSGTLSSAELSDHLLARSGLLAFNQIDTNHNGLIDINELVAELHRAFSVALATGDNTFVMSDFGGMMSGGYSVDWLRSAYREEPLGPQVLKLRMSTYIYHGLADMNALPDPVYQLEKQARVLNKLNMKFTFFEGLGHELSKDVVVKMLVESADRISRFKVVKK